MAGAPAVRGSFATVDEVMLAAAEQIGDHEAFVEVATGRRLTFGQWVQAGHANSANGACNRAMSSP